MNDETKPWNRYGRFDRFEVYTVGENTDHLEGAFDRFEDARNYAIELANKLLVCSIVIKDLYLPPVDDLVVWRWKT